jgi:hypothetical protein
MRTCRSRALVLGLKQAEYGVLEKKHEKNVGAVENFIVCVQDWQTGGGLRHTYRSILVLCEPDYMISTWM